MEPKTPRPRYLQNNNVLAQSFFLTVKQRCLNSLNSDGSNSENLHGIYHQQ
jgi:hypothetical protein